MEQNSVDNIVKQVIISYPYILDDKQVRNKIKELIVRTNPYRLTEYKNDIEFIKDMIKTYLDKSWTTIFGNILEQIQILVSEGKKTAEVGVDIELPKKNAYVGSKSGPNWANSDQRKSMLRNSKTLKENKHCEVFVVCSYGKSEQKYEHYTQIAGQKGWEFLSDDEKMYQKVMVGFINNTDLLQDLKNRVFGDLENSVVDYWVKNFYTNNQFNSMKYLDFVSAKDKK